MHVAKYDESSRAKYTTFILDTAANPSFELVHEAMKKTNHKANVVYTNQVVQQQQKQPSSIEDE